MRAAPAPYTFLKDNATPLNLDPPSVWTPPLVWTRAYHVLISFISPRTDFLISRCEISRRLEIPHRPCEKKSVHGPGRPALRKKSVHGPGRPGLRKKISTWPWPAWAAKRKHAMVLASLACEKKHAMALASLACEKTCHGPPACEISRHGHGMIFGNVGFHAMAMT